jgi:PAS domain S-box-containing protein
MPSEEDKPKRDLKSSLDALRSRIEGEARREKAYLEHLFEGAPEALVVAENSGRILLVNGEFTRMFGFEREEAVGRYIDDLVVPDDLVEQGRRVTDLSSKGRRIAQETIRRRKDGSTIHVSLIAAPILMDDKQVGVYGIYRDISRRREIEEALRKEKAYLEQLFENAQEGIVLADNTGRILHVNGEFARMFGYNRQEVVGRHVDDLVATPDLRGQAEGLTHSAAEGQQASIEAVRRRKDGGRFPVSILASPIMVDGVQAGVYAIYRDITARVQLEEQIRHTQKLESLGVLAGGIAHDFNNILMTILGNAGLALQDLPENSPHRTYLTAIEQASRRAANLCRQMLAYSGKGKFVVETVNLSDLAHKMASSLAEQLPEGARFEEDFAADVPSIIADAAQLSQVTMNLVTNASEALEGKSGTVTLRTGVRHCSRQSHQKNYLDRDLPEGRYVFIEVSDTGAGMSDETLSRLFDPFFSTKFTGRGLGLSAVLGIVRGHHGAVQVQSRLGSGSSFTVLFPATDMPTSEFVTTDDKEGSAEAPEDKEPVRGSGTVLVVDDEDTVRDLAADVLKEIGFKVLTAAGGQEAVDIFQKKSKKVSCVLLDLSMPGMSGEECFEKLREIRPDIPVVITSGFTAEEIADRFQGRDPVEILQKPYSPKELGRIISSMSGPGPS